MGAMLEREETQTSIISHLIQEHQNYDGTDYPDNFKEHFVGQARLGLGLGYFRKFTFRRGKLEGNLFQILSFHSLPFLWDASKAYHAFLIKINKFIIQNYSELFFQGLRGAFK